MKKIFSIVLSVLLIIGCVIPTMTVSADAGEIKPYYQNGYLFYEADKGTLSAENAGIAYADWYGGRPNCTENIFVILTGGSVSLNIDVPYSGYYNIGVCGSTYNENDDAYCSLWVNGYEYYYLANHSNYCQWPIIGASYYDYGTSGFATAGGIWLNAGSNTVSFNYNNGWILIDRLAISVNSVNIPNDDAVAVVNKAIEDLPAELDVDTYKGVATIKENYDALNDFQKSLIKSENYTKLLAKIEEAKEFELIPCEVFNDDGYSYQAESAILANATTENYLTATGDKFIDIKDGTATFKFKVPYDGWYKVYFATSTYNNNDDTKAKVTIGADEYFVSADHTKYGTWTMSGLETYNYDNYEYVSYSGGLQFSASEINTVTLSSKDGFWMLFDRMVLVPDSLTYPENDVAGTVFNTIQALPESEDLTIENKAQVQAAKSAYDDLTAIQRVAIINFDKLTAVFNEMTELNIIENKYVDGNLVYEAENAMYTDRAAITDDNSASGGKYINIAYGTLFMNINVPIAGKYKVIVVGSTNNAENSKCDIVYVNKVNAGYVAYSKSSYGTWAECEPGAENWVEGEMKPTPAESIDFSAGDNMVIIRANWGNTNYDKVVLVPVSGNVKADVNADGELNASDLSGLVQHILGSDTVTLPDVNGDGKVNILDVVALKKIFASL